MSLPIVFVRSSMSFAFHSCVRVLFVCSSVLLAGLG